MYMEQECQFMDIWTREETTPQNHFDSLQKLWKCIQITTTIQNNINRILKYILKWLITQLITLISPIITQLTNIEHKLPSQVHHYDSTWVQESENLYHYSVSITKLLFKMINNNIFNIIIKIYRRCITNIV